MIRKVKLAYSICRQHLEAMASARAQLMTAEILHCMNIKLYEYYTIFLLGQITAPAFYGWQK